MSDSDLLIRTCNSCLAVRYYNDETTLEYVGVCENCDSQFYADGIYYDYKPNIILIQYELEDEKFPHGFQGGPGIEGFNYPSNCVIIDEES